MSEKKSAEQGRRGKKHSEGTNFLKALSDFIKKGVEEQGKFYLSERPEPNKKSHKEDPSPSQKPGL